MNNIQTFIPKRDRFGRFKPSRKTVFKLICVLLVLGSFYGNYFLLKKHYVISCKEGGHLMSKETCNEISENFYAAVELNRQNNVDNQAVLDDLDVINFK